MAGNKLTHKPNLNEMQRARLIAFLSHRYSHPYDLCLDAPGYLEKIFTWAVHSADPIDAYLDPSDWTPDKINSFTA